MATTVDRTPIQRAHDASAACVEWFRERRGDTRESLQTVLFSCGILASLRYVVGVALAPLRWPEYSPTFQAISELTTLTMVWVVLVLLAVGSSGARPPLALSFAAAAR